MPVFPNKKRTIYCCCMFVDMQSTSSVSNRSCLYPVWVNCDYLIITLSAAVIFPNSKIKRLFFFVIFSFHHVLHSSDWAVTFQPASKNRRERTELKPDYFDPSSIMDDSVRIVHFLEYVFPFSYRPGGKFIFHDLETIFMTGFFITQHRPSSDATVSAIGWHTASESALL